MEVLILIFLSIIAVYICFKIEDAGKEKKLLEFERDAAAKRKVDLLKIINYFGVMLQIEKLKEEVWEVIDAIYNKERKDIAEEIADVKVVLEQLQAFYEIPEEAIEEIKDKKIKRTLERIESGYYEREELKWKN